MIKLDNVFKYYRSHGHRKVVLDHVSLDFAAGRSYGILGVNGAGKSTLMRLLAGTELPNGGRVVRPSRVSWPLGFSGGLHPMLSGRENVKFVARVYGQDARKVIDFVEDFAEIGAYIDAPIRTYSSGMMARLAFGLSALDRIRLLSHRRGHRRRRRALRGAVQEEFSKRRRTADVIMVSHAMSNHSAILRSRHGAGGRANARLQQCRRRDRTL